MCALEEVFPSLYPRGLRTEVDVVKPRQGNLTRPIRL